MPVTPGTKLGSYEILAPLGAGGMGEVYRARDTKLNRDVAIKILPSAFAQDADRLRRFEREAQVLAALNHPNIAQIYGLEGNALVMELVEGETLSGPKPIDEAIAIARQIAEALEYAHEKGIIHRDLKPSNIKITPQGQVKVLDFGLAKAMAEDPASQEYANSPTMSLAATKMGVILGTAGYMSPEQAKGAAVDKRADIWAFGAVFFELLAGKRLIDEPTASEAMAAVLKSDLDLAALPADTPPRIRRLIERCLKRDPKQRLRDIGEARIAIDEALGGASESAAPQPRAHSTVWIVVAAVLGVLLLSLGIVHFRETPPKLTTVRFPLPLPENTVLLPREYPVVSPNGEYIAFTVGQSGLRVRPIGSLTVRSFAGTVGAGIPFWSPDSRFLGFSIYGKLMKVDVSSGALQAICDCATGVSGVAGAWGPDGTIIFSRYLGPLFRVAAAGGEAKPLTELDSARLETQHARPSFLPDGRHFLYVALGSKVDNNGVLVGSLDWKDPKESKDAKRLIAGASNAIYAPSPSGKGYLLFERAQALVAQSFDAKKLQLAGDPVPVAEEIASNGFGGFSFSASESGVLAYRASTGEGLVQLTWFDRSGKRLETLGEPGDYSVPALSPDEKRVAVGRRDPATTTRDIWVFDLARGTSSRLTFDPADDFSPTWSPDGTHIAFSSDRKGVRNMYQKMASGTGEDEVVLESADLKNIESWSPDGRFLIYNVANGNGGVWMLPLFGERKPAVLLPPPFNKVHAQLSPNGRWIAYTSTESGRREAYVQSFPPSGGKWQISTAGGFQPVWRSDGKELFFVTNSKVFAVPVETQGPAFEAGIPAVLFETPIAGFGARSSYVVAANGQRFLVMTPMEDKNRATPPYTVVLNWAAGLK